MHRLTTSAAILLGSIASFYPLFDTSASTVVWRAEDFATGANGNVANPDGTVTDWISTAGTSVESDSDGGLGVPLFIPDATPGGTGVINFSGSRMNGSDVENPVTGFNQFSVAFVF